MLLQAHKQQLNCLTASTYFNTRLQAHNNNSHSNIMLSLINNNNNNNDDNINSLNNSGIKSITINYTLPYNTNINNQIMLRSDLTVDYFKLQLYKKHNINVDIFNVFYNDVNNNDNNNNNNILLNEPMSFCDFRFVKDILATQSNPSIHVYCDYTDEYKQANKDSNNNSLIGNTILSNRNRDTDDELSELESDELVDSDSDDSDNDDD